jgi:hypothetical protein
MYTLSDEFFAPEHKPRELLFVAEWGARGMGSDEITRTQLSYLNELWPFC